MLLSAQTIRNMHPKLILPFCERGVFEGMSYGLSCCGYDIRVAQDLKLAPGQFTLASSLETFNMPRNIAAYVKDKSTLARRGLAVQNTFIEPGWRGVLTLELTNHQPKPPFWRFASQANHIILKKGSPIAQIVFTFVDAPTDQPYVGKYQDQGPEPTPAILEGSPPR